MIYYNEFDPRKAAMLRQLMYEGFIPKGDIDERSIREVQSGDLAGYTQCHFFAGIGAWAIALQLAGWGDTPVWTGSCPCQPFSVAGRQEGRADERHLWPEWFRLIKECQPATIFGEQVEAAIAHGWLDDVYQGLEAEGYAVGSAVLPACSVGAPHRRNRLWFVGDHQHAGLSTTQVRRGLEASVFDNEKRQDRSCESKGAGPSSVLPADVDNAQCEGLEGHRRSGQVKGTQGRETEVRHNATTSWVDSEWAGCTDGKHRLISTQPAVRPLVNGFQQRRWLLSATGDAIVPQVAASFIKATMMEEGEGDA